MLDSLYKHLRTCKIECFKRRKMKVFDSTTVTKNNHQNYGRDFFEVIKKQNTPTAR